MNYVAKHVWYWADTHYKHGILAAGIIIDVDSGEIWFLDECIANSGNQEPFVPNKNEWIPVSCEFGI